MVNLAINLDSDFRVNMYRIESGVGTNGTIGTNQESSEIIISLIKTNPKITQDEISKQSGMSPRTAKRVIDE